MGHQATAVAFGLLTRAHVGDTRGAVPYAATTKYLVASLLLLTAVAFAVLLAIPQVGASADALQCDTSGKTIRSNAVARVFRARARRGYVYYGCMRETGRVFRLVRTRRGLPLVNIPRLTGGFFAAELIAFRLDGPPAFGVTLWNLSAGTRSHWDTDRGDFVGGDIEVTSEGAIAWVTGGLTEVWKADADGRAMIGAAFPRRKPWKTLTLTGGTLSWPKGVGAIGSYLLRGAATEGSATARR